MKSAYLESSIFLNNSIEEQLLLCCARTHINDQISQKIRLLIQNKVDWKYLIELASSHQIIPLLYKNLKHISSDELPIDSLTQLREINHKNMAISMSLTAKLLDIYNCFKSKNICVIPYKGAVLAAIVYKDICLRQFRDIDLLVSFQDVHQSIEVLNSQGYQLKVDSFNPIYKWEETLINPKTGIVIDLHHGIAQSHYPFRLNLEHCIQRSQNVDLLDTTIQSFSTIDLLLILSIQIVKDSYDQACLLAKICDISELANQFPVMEWSIAIERANSIGCQRLLLIALLLANKLLGTILPTSIWQLIKKDWIVCQYGKLLSHKFFRPKTNSPVFFILKILILIEYPLSAPHNISLLKDILTYPYKKWLSLKSKVELSS
jgi:Uncharacterised nucleotidyltransferase